MTRALLLGFSPHGKAAQTFKLARALLRDLVPHATVTERDYGGQALPPLTREYANALTTAGGLSGKATALSEQLIVELEACDLLILCTPVHNFTVPAALKAWIDHVVRIQRSFTVNAQLAKVGLLEDRRTFVLVSSGNARKGHEPDFLTPYMTAILATVGIESVDFVYLPAMVRGEEAVNRALEQAHRQLSLAISSGL
ncbi:MULTISPECIES: FMN-dependent NADH-azoreductase [Pseudomonas]|jgi:FMN-dependent NADH-azoreductase|uniref:FMN dependent NADH:quinone oxidoreductase n=1 Tax=Pseudomonas extremorientalis TaxID=169669 RepID=A0A1H0IKJ8_9PSED|nr:MULTISPECIES: NAD(P)H-dependent oxidoreductase [Pseudomonas]KAB0519837.1 FMN-dependent NADH-azoreductase [Pseudomonas extremorientalis]OIN10314.1 FMN-dependent NADH-azoreductase [Pseudomonas extremorientalis]QZP18987.1 NAD(P)H-dependent oxidoreductase [Pseudomonas sp. DR208]UUN91355.1 NAD(P)H-dependent oxidoreductase [Pseudomonas extremorientalis]SDO31999.1 FMN-dependent NADH-azoreductase [Pseudomonas extremorientalis]